MFIATTARQSGWESIYEYTLGGAKIAEYRLTTRDGSVVQRAADLVVRDHRLVVTGSDGRLHECHLPVRTLLE